MNNFVKRTITGVLFVILIIGSIILSPLAFAALFLLVSAGGLLEYSRIAKALGSGLNPWVLLASGTILYIFIALTANGLIKQEVLIFGLLLFPAIMIFELFRKTNTPLANISYSIAGLIWIVTPIALLNGFYNHSEGPAWFNSGALLGFFLILWIYDSGAYITGSLFGKTKMIERISPKKSWEGFAGGVLFGFSTAYLVSASFTEFTLSEWLLIALLIIIFGTLGDFSESMVKRSASIKDSGNILPGHGGILDRFDAVFIASPAVFLLIYYLR
ncbi:MAG: phosphatidate cytidylyltransferase [Lentimicrobium sp.]|nr:phosphatidate cytidylyltransferase [Lentimicrobium sp.]